MKSGCQSMILESGSLKLIGQFCRDWNLLTNQVIEEQSVEAFKKAVMSCLSSTFYQLHLVSYCNTCTYTFAHLQ